MLLFDDVSHTYRWKGRKVPCVSDILAPVTDYASVPRKYLERAANRGTAVHLACELDDRDILDYSSLDDEVMGYLVGWQSFVRDYKPKWTSIEERFYSSHHDFAGTPDRTADIDGYDSIVDIKTTKKIGPWVGLQLAGYSLGKGLPASANVKRYAVQLMPDGKYMAHEFKELSDYPTFLSLLNITKWNARFLKDIK